MLSNSVFFEVDIIFWTFNIKGWDSPTLKLLIQDDEMSIKSETEEEEFFDCDEEDEVDEDEFDKNETFDQMEVDQDESQIKQVVPHW